MAKLKLNQNAPFQLVGVCLKPETHEYPLDDFKKLLAEPSFQLTVDAGLIEIVECELEAVKETVEVASKKPKKK
jgi:hypothetical protein